METTKITALHSPKLLTIYKENKMKKIAILLLAAFAISANAHGPVRGKLTAAVIINAPAAKVWEVVQNYDDLSWLPPVAKTTADNGNNQGSKRVITLKGGGTINETLKKYNAGKMSYKYKITSMSATSSVRHAGKDEPIPVVPVANYAATISVVAKDGKSIVIWVATYYRSYVNNNPPPQLNEKAADSAISAIFTAGLTSLAQRFDPNTSAAAVKIRIKR